MPCNLTNALQSLPIQCALFTLHINQYLIKIVSVYIHKLSVHCSISLPIQWTLCALQTIPYKDSTIVSVFYYQLDVPNVGNLSF